MEITVRINDDRRATDNPIETAIRSRIAKIYSDATGKRLNSVKRQVRMNVRPASALVFVNDAPFARFKFSDFADLTARKRNATIPMTVKMVRS